MPYFICQNCGTKHKYFAVDSEPEHKPGWFASTFKLQSFTVEDGLKYIIFGGKKKAPPTDRHITVKSEVWTSPSQLKIGEGRIPVDILPEMRRLYLDLKEPWSRKTNCEALGLSQPAANSLKDALLDLHYLEPVNSRQYRLTTAGRYFLRNYEHYLENRP